jgi:hypothetical protein
MSTLDLVKNHLLSWPQPEAINDGNTVVVPTHFLYPSRTVVTLHVECNGDRVRVSDGGGALREISEVGTFQFDVLKMLRSRAKSWDLTVSAEGWLLSEHLPIQNLADLVAWVATASHDLAAGLMSKMTTRPKIADFRQELDVYLEQKFTLNLKRNKSFVGASNKGHKFDYFVSLNGDDRGLIIDAALNDVSSINSAVVSHLDVAQVERPHLIQRIVYDDREEWKAADLSLLRVGATPLAFSKLDASLSKAIQPY